MACALIIPAYNPNGRLPALLRAVAPHFERVILVDDGSTEGREYIEEARHLVSEVLVHPLNRGKGAALKTAFAALKSDEDAVTADADGQHAPEDILRVAAALKTCREGLVLGCRQREGATPLLSRLGNGWSRLFFRLLLGFSVSDTQTGLRGVPASLVPRLRELPGERYDYEQVMLLEARHFRDKVVEVPIKKVYFDGNAASHFRPFRDTLRNHFALLKAFFKSRRA